MNNKRKVLTMIEFDERQVTPRFQTDKLLPKNVYLLREPFDSVIKNQNFRFAVLDKDKKNAFFLHDKRVFSLEEVKKVLPRQEMFVCEFLANNLHNTVHSQNLSVFCMCDQVGDREMLHKGTQSKALKLRLKKFEDMQNSLKTINPKMPISVEELLRYERLFVCVQERCSREEKNQKEIFDFEK